MFIFHLLKQYIIKIQQDWVILCVVMILYDVSLKGSWGVAKSFGH